MAQGDGLALVSAATQETGTKRQREAVMSQEKVADIMSSDSHGQPEVGIEDSGWLETCLEGVLEQEAADKAQGILKAQGDFKRRRFSHKAQRCKCCGGPCTEGECAGPATKEAKVVQAEGPEGMGNNDLDYDEELECSGAADAFAKAVAAHRKRAMVTSGGPSSSSTSAPVASEAPPKKKRKVRDRPCRASADFGKLPDWLAANPTVGRVVLHHTHTLGWHRGLIWCWKCGHYGASVPVKLKGECKTKTLAGEQNLHRLGQGRPPQKAAWPHEEYTT